MNVYFSDYFNVQPELINDYGAFNISLINDLPLFIDPFLLFNSSNEQYKVLHQQIIKYVKFLKSVSSDKTLDRGSLLSWFMFPEVKQNWFGYSLVGNRGSGLGIEFAKALNKSLNTIFSDFGDETISKSSHLEKLCLVKGGVGRDNISDFTSNLIKSFLLEYTQQFAIDNINNKLRKKFHIERVKFNYKTMSWERGYFELPFYDNDYVLLTPKDILTKDDTWINKSDLVDDFDEIAYSIPNDQLRAQINNYFRRVLIHDPKKEPTKKEKSEAVISTISKFPELIDYYIRLKEDHGEDARKLSDEKIENSEILYIKQLKQFINRLGNLTKFYQISGDTYNEARNRILFLKDVIENKGGHKIFYVKGRPIKRESDLHILFRLTWYAGISDVSREVNDGRGPVDFKISRGAFDKTLVEFKLAKNTQLKRNLAKQVPIYEKASDTDKSIKVILYFSDSEFERVNKILGELGLDGNKDIILIDGSWENKPSGSIA